MNYFENIVFLACGGVLRGDGALQVPVFPEESSFPQSCIWTIEYPEGSQIVVSGFRDIGLI